MNLKIAIIGNPEQTDEVNELITDFCQDPDNVVVKVLQSVDVVYVLDDRIDVKRSAHEIRLTA